MVAELWKLRYEASHQGRAFGEEFVPATARVEFLTLGTMVFGVDHIEQAQTIDELWTKASAYTLPSEAIQERGTLRGRISNAILETRSQWTAMGTLFDQFFNQ